MNILKALSLVLTIIFINSAFASQSISNFNSLVSLKGDWVLAPASEQEGGTTKKGPAAKLINTDKTAISFRVIGKGSTVQENLLPGTGKEMATMYHCNNFKKCTQLKAKHYCAKQNQPEFILDSAKSGNGTITLACDANNDVCNSKAGHVHKITHVLSKDKNQLKTTYTIFSKGKYKKDSIYHFVKK